MKRKKKKKKAIEFTKVLPKTDKRESLILLKKKKGGVYIPSRRRAS